MPNENEDPLKRTMALIDEHKDKFSDDDPMGEVRLPMQQQRLCVASEATCAAAAAVCGE